MTPRIPNKEAALASPLRRRCVRTLMAGALDSAEETGGVQDRTAERLGINRHGLWHRIKRDGIDPAAFKKARANTGRRAPNRRRG